MLKTDLEWRIFAAPDIPDGLFDHGETVGENLVLPDGRTVKEMKYHFPACGVQEMNEVIQPNPAVLARTVLVCDFESPCEDTGFIGVGVDWFLTLRLNGRVILDTRKTGNGESEISPENYILQFTARKGKNQFIYEVFGGEASFKVAAKLMDMEPLAVSYGPWAHFPDAAQGAMTITFTSNRKAPAGVDYRETGTQEWTRKYDTIGGQIRRDRDVHNIRLKNLKPDTEYEYRAILFDRCREMIEEPYGETRTFRTAAAPGKDFSFITSSDLQVTNQKRKQFLEKLFHSPDGKKADFFAFTGDVCWTSHFDRDCVEALIVPFLNATDNRKMLEFVRGNHELYGSDSNRFFDYFTQPAPGREGYGMFRWGDVCFFVLDFCDDTPRMPYPSTRSLHDFEDYIEGEAQWLKEAVQLPACREAKYRIALAHGLPVGDPNPYMPGHVRQVIDPVFSGENPVCKIHLWIGGHVHYPLRSIPGENRWRCLYDIAAQYPKFAPLPRIGTKYHFPVVVHSGPSSAKPRPPELVMTSMFIQVTAKGIHVEHKDMEGQVFDRILVAPDGKVTEEFSAPWFRMFEY